MSYSRTLAPENPRTLTLETKFIFSHFVLKLISETLKTEDLWM